jgi:hypothetical protein
MSCLLFAALLAAAPAEATTLPGTAAIERGQQVAGLSPHEPRSSAEPSSPGGERSESAEPRRFHELNEDLRGYIREFARTDDSREKGELVGQMCTLYLEIKRDPRLLTSDTLKSYKAKLWSVLKRIESDLQQQASRRQRQRGTSDTPTNPGIAPQQRDGSDAATDVAADSLAGTLSLLGGLLGGPGDLLAHGGSYGGGSFGGGSPRTGTSATGTSATGSSGTEVPGTGSAGTGKHGAAAAGAFGGGAAGADYGPALVELIQRTIAPEFWDVNGGPGTIVYYAPLRVLVVRATSEMHHDVGAAVGAIRRAGQ